MSAELDNGFSDMDLEAGQIDYSIIIPAYNEADELPATLKSVQAAQQRCPDRRGQVIVVDNASTDRTAEIARQAGNQVVFEPEHRISRVRNTGAKASKGRYLIFLDADTLMESGLLTEALAALDNRRVCGGGSTVLYKGNPGGFARHLVRTWALISRRRRWAAGSFLFCLRKAFEEVGGFDETVYYSEEVILSKALRKWGRKRKMDFIVLKTPVYTSPRKFLWFSSWYIFLSLLLAPFWKQNKDKSRLWYRRPER